MAKIGCSFDATSLAPNFDLLLNNRQAEQITQIIVGWQFDNPNFYTSKFDENGILQVPPPVESENCLGLREVILKYEGPTTERTWDNQKVAEILSAHTELRRFVTMMERILPYQGTNTRVFLFKCLLLMERDGLVPELRVTDLNEVVEEVIKNGWLDQPPPVAYAEQTQGKSVALHEWIKWPGPA